jgi:threonylcarbamoyladenosine tRNA methylthiotransferase MtaB
MPSYCIVTFGCRVNQADSLEAERQLRAAGFMPADREHADVVIFNTCSVTATADQGARQTIRRVHRDNPRARLIATGCYATRAAHEVSELPGIVGVVDNSRKHTLPDQILNLLGPTVRPRFDGGDGPCGQAIEPGLAGRTAWTLRVQTGCEQTCTYCIIPRTRGASRSRPLADVLNEVASVAAAGFKEIAITGVHLGSWGRDLSPRLGLTDLLAALSDHPADITFRISSLEPMDCTPRIVERLTTTGTFAPHLHLPLQHASDDILRAMRRPYDLRYYAGLVGTIRSMLPHAALGSDILVGFPGETDDDHRRNLAFLERSPLTHLHVFPYSDRPGTAASTFSGKVHGGDVRARADEIRAVSRELANRFRASMVGSVRPGLTLEDGTLVVTDNFLKVRIPPGLPRNQRVQVRILEDDEPMTGEVCSSYVASAFRRTYPLPGSG